MWNVAHIIGPTKVKLDIETNFGPSNQHCATLCNCVVSENTVTSESNGKTMSLSLALFTLIVDSYYSALAF